MAAITRCGNWLNNVIEVNRPGSEVRDALDKVENAYNELVVKHEDYTKLIDDDTKFEEAETWMEDCQGSFMNYVMRAKMYFESLVSQEKQTLESGATTKKTASNEQTRSEFQVCNLEWMWFPVPPLMITNKSLLSMQSRIIYHHPQLMTTVVKMEMYKFQIS